MDGTLGLVGVVEVVEVHQGILLVQGSRSFGLSGSEVIRGGRAVGWTALSGGFIGFRSLGRGL